MRTSTRSTVSAAWSSPLKALKQDHPVVQVKTTDDLTNTVSLGDFFALLGPERLFLLTAAERSDPFVELPAAPASCPNYWMDAIERLIEKGLLTEEEKPSERGWNLVALLGFRRDTPDAPNEGTPGDERTLQAVQEATRRHS